MKTAKRFLTAALAVLFTLMCALPALAADEAETTPNKTYTLTIENAEANHTYEAYQVFKGTYSQDEDGEYLSDIVWGNGVQNTDALVAELKEAKIYYQGDTAVEKVNDATKVAMALSKMENEAASVDRFNEIVGGYLTETPTASVKVKEAGTVTLQLEAGYYLVKDQNNSIKWDDDSYTKYLVRLVADTTMEPKTQSMQLDKKILESNGTDTANNAAIGDTVKYEIDTATSDMNGYETYTFTIHDELDGGLTFDPESLNVTVGGEAYADYKISYSYTGNAGDYSNTFSEQEGTKLYIKIDLLQLVENEMTNKKVVVTYSATVNKEAVIGEDPNTNKAYLEYSNNPNMSQPDYPSTSTTPEKSVYTYVAGLEIIKVSPEGYYLPGAQFKITGDNINKLNVIGYSFKKDTEGNYRDNEDDSYTTSIPDNYEGNRYIAEGDTHLKEDKPIVGMTGDDANGTTLGKLRFNGLKAGTYTVSEVLAPSGYKPLDQDIVVEITWTAPTEGTKCSWNYDVKVDSADEKIVQQGDTKDSFKILNKHGLNLPFTGGEGANLLAGLGLALMVAAGAAFLYIKRRQNRE